MTDVPEKAFLAHKFSYHDERNLNTRKLSNILLTCFLRSEIAHSYAPSEIYDIQILSTLSYPIVSAVSNFQYGLCRRKYRKVYYLYEYSFVEPNGASQSTK